MEPVYFIKEDKGNTTTRKLGAFPRTKKPPCPAPPLKVAGAYPMGPDVRCQLNIVHIEPDRDFSEAGADADIPAPKAVAGMGAATVPRVEQFRRFNPDDSIIPRVWTFPPLVWKEPQYEFEILPKPGMLSSMFYRIAARISILSPLQRILMSFVHIPLRVLTALIRFITFCKNYLGSMPPNSSPKEAIDLTSEILPRRPVKLALYHDTTPENAQRIWERGAFEPQVRSTKIVYDQPSGVYCLSRESGGKIGFAAAGVFPRMILEIMINVNKPLDTRNGSGHSEYDKLLEIARTRATYQAIDVSLANDRPEFGKVFRTVLMEAGYDAVVMGTRDDSSMIVVLEPKNIQVKSIQEHYQYQGAGGGYSHDVDIRVGRDHPCKQLPLPEWSRIPLKK